MLALLNNGLSGSIPDSLNEASGLRVLQVADNDLSGTWSLASDGYARLVMADLSENNLSSIEIQAGSAPRIAFLIAPDNQLQSLPSGISSLTSLGNLDLAFNRMEGALPDSFSDLELRGLSLQGNELTGSVLPALRAMSETLLDPPDPDNPDEPVETDIGVVLDLRDNRFTGVLDESILEQSRDAEKWVNLCWNDLSISDEEAMDWLESEHADRPYEVCVNRTLADTDPGLSGSWYDPERAGEGFSVMLLEDGQTMVHWFTYSPADATPQRQNWLTGSELIEHPGLEPLVAHAPTDGQFGQGLDNPQNYPLDMAGDLNLAWLENGKLMSERRIGTALGAPPVSQNIEMVQLSTLAGTTCDNQSPYQKYSGAWYNPSRSGEGFVVEVLPDESVVVYWFTYEPGQTGYQSWMVGDGQFLPGGPGTDPISVYENRLEVDMLRPVGGTFGPDFDPDAIEAIDWGTVEIRFDAGGDGHVIWQSEMPGYGQGNYELERLAKPKLADCD